MSPGNIAGLFQSSKVCDLHLGKGRTASVGSTDRYKHRPLHLPCTAKEAFVQLRQPSQFISTISMAHGTANLVSHRPNRLVGTNTQEPLSFQDRDPVLILAHQQNQPKPFLQRNSGLVEETCLRHLRHRYKPRVRMRPALSCLQAGHRKPWGQR